MASMQFDIITIFPHIFDSYLGESILGRAQKNKLIDITMHDLREWTNDKHNTVDDTPYGGGVGMVLMAEPIMRALASVKNTYHADDTKHQTPISNNQENIKNQSSKKTRSILLSPSGKRFTQKKALELTQYDQLIFVAGRYEGVDHRVTELVDETISIGDFVLNGGELPAVTIIEAVSRLLPGVLGKDASSEEESFSDEDSKEYPQYTRPEVFTTDEGKELKVPEVLLSGNHAHIAKWRKEQRKK